MVLKIDCGFGGFFDTWTAMYWHGDTCFFYQIKWYHRLLGWQAGFLSKKNLLGLKIFHLHPYETRKKPDRKTSVDVRPYYDGLKE